MGDKEKAKLEAWLAHCRIFHAGEASAPIIEKAAINSGFDAGLAHAQQWVDVSERLPELLDWYVVTIEEVSDLGTSRYVDIISFGNTVEGGNHFILSPGEGRVVAWRPRPEPFTPTSTEGGTEDVSREG